MRVAEAGGGRVLGVRLVGPQVPETVAESRLIVGWDAGAAGGGPDNPAGTYGSTRCR
ncbi:hypothetical protein M2161_007118 [Streptomyces sp. SAI-133]|uniref:hypothetical protein n=1 Tax=unclassified Streptomyces TaxID=2593676 RepID=UPI002474D903|nr:MULTISPECIES: hypothetical protein [unclassified Streptomyces]MDH6547964.1 hypothetical protein [Streptomyces sp. SAI-041]MDH6588012.1 hypothetical protein [Streptomyces sp. SAI-133]